MGLAAPRHVESYFPRPGTEPMSPAWPGGFPTTGPPGKPTDGGFASGPGTGAGVSWAEKLSFWKSWHKQGQRRPCLGSWAQPILDKLKASITSVPHDEDAHLRPGGPSSHHWSSGPGIQVSPTLVLCSWWGFRGGTHRLPCLFSWAASAQEVPALGEGLGKISLPFEGEAGRGMRNFGDSVDGSRLGQTLSGAVCRGFVQTSRWRKRNARGGRLRYILDRSKDVLTLVTHSKKDEAGAELGRVPEEGSEPPAWSPCAAHGHPCCPGGWASLLPPQAGSLDPCEALPGPSASGFHQTSKSRLYYYCYCYYYHLYVFSDDRSTSGLL